MRSMQIQNAEKVLLEIWYLLGDLNIVFFLRHGTCLGAVRDGELIPWDDDLDIGSIIGMHGLDESAVSRAVERFKAADFQVKVMETDFHIAVELSKYDIPIDWTCYRVIQDSIFQYPGVKIPVRIYGNLDSVSLLGKPFSIPNPPEEYLAIKYGPNWRVPKKTGFEADIIDAIPETVNLAKPSAFMRLRKFLFFKNSVTRIQVLSSNLEPIPNLDVTIVGIAKRVTDPSGYAVFDLLQEDYYAVTVGNGEEREILYEERLEPRKDYSYIQDPNEKQGRIRTLQEKT